MDKYRLLNQREEIAQMVKKAPIQELGQIWQTLPLRRDIYPITNVEVLTDGLIFQTSIPFQFDITFPVYVQINYRNLIFKLSLEDYQALGQQLICTYPNEAQAIEGRTKERTKLPKKSNLSLTLRALSNEKEMDVKVKLINLSELGIGITASIFNRDLFERNSFFQVVKVCGRHHTEYSRLTVKHISDDDPQGFRVSIGFLLDKAFSERFFEILREEIKREKYQGRVPIE